MTAIAHKPIPQGTTSQDPGVIASLLWIVGLVAFQFIGIFIAILFETITTGNSNPMEMGATTLMFGVLVGSLLLIALRSKYMLRHLKPAWDGSSPHALSKKSLLITGALVLGTAIFSALYQTFVLGDQDMQPELVIFLNAMQGGTVGVVMVFLVGALAAPVLEEILFRGQLQGAVQEKLKNNSNSAVYAILITAGVFSIIHFQPLAIPPLFVAGCAFGWIRWRSGSLALPIVAHVAMNFLSLLILLMTGEI